MRLPFIHLISYLLVAALYLPSAHAQTSFVLSGRITDATSHEPLIGATVFLKKNNTGSVTDTNGYYSIQTPGGPDTLVISYLGYTTKNQAIIISRDQSMYVQLSSAAIESKEVVVNGERNNNNVTSTETSRIEIKGETIKSLPVVFGEPDVLKAITLLPGIKNGGEGGGGFYVRGGGPDQNLVMMDGAVIYNPTHLFGFLSVFNTDAVNNVEIIKGGMPANYGGRLSSVLNVNLREGNDQKYVISGGIGLISSRLMFEGPIKKNKSGFMIAARRTYIDALAKPFLTREQRANGYYFYDVNVKFHYYLSNKDKIYFSGYFGKDIFTFQSPLNKEIRFETDWGNTAATLRWNHAFHSKFYCNTFLIYNRFDLRSQFSFGNDGFKLRSGLSDWTLKQDYVYTPNTKHTLKSGWQYIYHAFVPGIAKGQIGTIAVDETITKQYAHEAAVYIADEWKIKSRLTINAGLRGVLFMQVGPFTETLFNEDDIQTGTGKTFSSGEPVVTYPGLEPRLAATYLFNSSTSVKASFTQTYQFLHLATTSGAQFPADLWVPSSQKVKPQLARQYVLGLYKNFKENEFETSVEAYYKPMYNQIEFKPGAQLFFNQNLENEMIFGQGLSYGVEFFVKKKFGKITGWAGYTWSKTTRQFDELNQGKTYYYRYDRRHDMSLVVSYQFSQKWSGTVVFVYGTGNAATLPTARYTYEPGYDPVKKEPVITFVDLYDKINDYRLPAYHRMDISCTYIQKKSERFESSWNFSVYNVYNRANPYFIYFAPNLETRTVKAYMVYLFPILPSVAWNFKF
jgi:hypothetical protein